MWRSLKEWEAMTAVWVKTQFTQIDAAAIEKEAVKFSKISNRVTKTLVDNPIGNRLKDLVDTFKGTMPIVVALRCPDLKDNHWKEIMDLLETDFEIEAEEFTLNSLIDMKAVNF